MEYKKYIAKVLNEYLELDLEAIESLIEIPPKLEMGDFSFPCFTLAKVMKKSPNVISTELKEKISDENFEKLEAFGPYLNFFLNKENFAKSIIEKILDEKQDYGSNINGEEKNIIVEYSSPNIAKPFHLGHLFTTVVGNSLYKLFKFHGYNAIRINHLGDWGTQFGKLIYAYNNWGDEEALESDPIKEMQRIYVKFHEEAEKNIAIEDEGRKHFKLLEEGNEEEVKLWIKFKEMSLKEFDKLYKTLNVSFDSFDGESFYTDKMDAVIEEIDEKGLLTDSNGAKVVMLDEYNMPPCIIKKADGATIYATRDLAAALYRKKTYDFYKNIYVVGKEQSLHFNQVFKTIELMGYDWAKQCTHVITGHLRFNNKKLATRKGDIILVEDLLNKSVERILEIIKDKNPELKNKEEIAKKIGIGAVAFNYLKSSREKDIDFNWDEILSFEGETGPYVQYTYARGKSILRKVGEEVTGEVDYGKLNSKEEFELSKELASFENTINNAIEKLQPSVLTRYCIEVAKAFNKFYNAHNIANSEDEGTRNARINLVKSTLQVLKNGLGLIGLEVVDKM